MKQRLVKQNAAQHSDDQMPRGYRPLYYADTVNHCPACGKRQWHIGRISAECAYCHTALALADVASQPMRLLFHVTCSATVQTA